MQLQVVILPSGEIGIFSQEGTFAGGQAALARLLADLQAAGIEFAAIGEVEQHRHEDAPAPQTAPQTQTPG